MNMEETEDLTKEVEEDDEEEEYLFVEVDENGYQPGQQVKGSVNWKFSDPAGQIEVRLLLVVSEKDETHKSYASGLSWNNLPKEGIGKFSLTPPDGPYSFLGKGLQIRWYVEANCVPLNFTDETEFEYSTTGDLLRLSPEST
jgi:hypothetical protein